MKERIFKNLKTTLTVEYPALILEKPFRKLFGI